jgi:hypothetical protein
MIYGLKKISEAPTDIDPHDAAAIERESKNWYYSIDQDGNEFAITNPITWKWEQRKPGIWYRIRPLPITISEALERVRELQRAQNQRG